ncbi:4-hydroxybenzoate polyprenyl transferase, partial [Vibrio parahaemolyticus V-223/04]
VTTGRC